MTTRRKGNGTSNTGDSVALQQPGNSGKAIGGCTGKGFRPGQSGNPSGKRKGEVSLTAWIKRALAGGKKLDQLGEAIFASALKGDVAAQKLIWDRIDGKVQDQIAAHLSGSIVAPIAAPSQVVIMLPPNGRDAPYPPQPIETPALVAPAPAALPAPTPEQEPAPEPKPVAVKPSEPAENEAERRWRLECARIDKANEEARARIKNHDQLKPSYSSNNPMGNGVFGL